MNAADQILFATAKICIHDVMNGKTAVPIKAWKDEYPKLTGDCKPFNQRYLTLKDEVKEAE